MYWFLLFYFSFILCLKVVGNLSNGCAWNWLTFFFLYSILFTIQSKWLLAENSYGKITYTYKGTCGFCVTHCVCVYMHGVCHAMYVLWRMRVRVYDSCQCVYNLSNIRNQHYDAHVPVYSIPNKPYMVNVLTNTKIHEWVQAKRLVVSLRHTYTTVRQRQIMNSLFFDNSFEHCHSNLNFLQRTFISFFFSKFGQFLEKI